MGRIIDCSDTSIVGSCLYWKIECASRTKCLFEGAAEALCLHVFFDEATVACFPLFMHTWHAEDSSSSANLNYCSRCLAIPVLFIAFGYIRHNQRRFFKYKNGSWKTCLHGSYYSNHMIHLLPISTVFTSPRHVDGTGRAEPGRAGIRPGSAQHTRKRSSLVITILEKFFVYHIQYLKKYTIPSNWTI